MRPRVAGEGARFQLNAKRSASPPRLFVCHSGEKRRIPTDHSRVRHQQREALLSRDLCITRSPSSLILTSPCPRREPALSFAEGSARFLSRRERFNASHLVMFVNAIS